MNDPTPEGRATIERRFIWTATLVAVLLAAIPALYAQIAAPRGSAYLGFDYNSDDHMVYAAWMRQAMEGRFFFDNRFTTDAQPGLTVHLYFWVLGLMAKVTGIPLAANLARLFFTGLFIPLLYRFVRGVSGSFFVTRLAVCLTVLAGGIGFLVWHNFGQEIVRHGGYNDALAPMMGGRLPVDVWQPEAFVFPSMLSNGLFMVSLCLILVAFLAFLAARDGWKPVIWGALAIGLLMNIHSYDVLMIGFTMAGFLVMQIASRRLTGAWLFRGLVIGSGVIPAALWFAHVLRSDPVFQARAATPTYSPDFRQVFFGYVLMMLLAFPGLFLRLQALRQRIGLGLLALIIAGLFAMNALAPGSKEHGIQSYFLSPPAFAGVCMLALACLALIAKATHPPTPQGLNAPIAQGPNAPTLQHSNTLDLILSWAVMGVIALYFPALFQRKLAMGLSVPWAILAGLGLAEMMKGREQRVRMFAVIASVLVLGLTSLCWLVRELHLIGRDVSNTTVHSVFLGHDEQEILRVLNNGSPGGRTVVLAMPGAHSADLDANGNPIPDEFSTPAVTDLNPVVSGLAGVYTYAGHWSETPDYLRRRQEASDVFLTQTSGERRARLLAKIQPDYIVMPAPETYGNAVFDLRSLGQVVYDGNRFKLIKVGR